MKNHPARLEPGKGKYMLYFILNERAVVLLPSNILCYSKRIDFDGLIDEMMYEGNSSTIADSKMIPMFRISSHQLNSTGT